MSHFLDSRYKGLIIFATDKARYPLHKPFLKCAGKMLWEALLVVLSRNRRRIPLITLLIKMPQQVHLKSSMAAALPNRLKKIVLLQRQSVKLPNIVKKELFPRTQISSNIGRPTVRSSHF